MVKFWHGFLLIKDKNILLIFLVIVKHLIMKRIIKELIGYDIEAIDGQKGVCKDFLLDEDEWKIRYIEIEAACPLVKKRLLVPSLFIGNSDWEDKKIFINLTRDQIMGCPELEEDMPVSRKYESELNKYYDIENYWMTATVPPMANDMLFYPPSPVVDPENVVKESDIDTNIRSLKELVGYRAIVLLDDVGTLSDVVVDSSNWQGFYIVLSTKFNRDILFPIKWLEKISFEDQNIYLNISYEEIKKFPEFNPNRPVIVEYEKALYDFHGRKVGQG